MVDKTDAHAEDEFQEKNFIEDPAQLDMYKAAGLIADGKFMRRFVSLHQSRFRIN